jgi:hypothetical protein
MQTKLAGLATALNVIDIASRLAGVVGAAYAFTTQMPAPRESPDDVRDVRVVAHAGHPRAAGRAEAIVRVHLPDPPAPPPPPREDERWEPVVRHR